MKNKKAFTLIELLVVISVLAGFMAMLVPNYMLARSKSRDTRRKSDMRSIQKALELYKLNQTPAAYPSTLTFSGSLSDANGVYMQKIPQDPQGSYFYARNTDDAGKYTLCACLENASDSDGSTCRTSDGNAPNGTVPTCSTNLFYKLNEP